MRRESMFLERGQSILEIFLPEKIGNRGEYQGAEKARYCEVQEENQDRVNGISHD